MTPVGPSQRRNAKSKKGKRTPWQVHGGALFDSLSNAAVTKLKERLGLNTEENYTDQNTSVAMSAAMVSHMSAPTIAQGTGVGARIGASIRITRIEVRLCLSAAAASTTGNLARFILTRNREAGVASAANVVQSTSLITSPLNHQIDALGLEVLMDVTVPINNAGIGPAWVHRTITDREWPDMHMIWPDTDTTGLGSALNEGCINLFAIVDSISTAPTLTGTLRFCYVDN